MVASKPSLASILIRSMDRPTLQRALNSAAAQTWPHVEIVVVSACGLAHRPLPATYQGRSLRLILPDSDRRLTRPEAANAGLDAAQGEWLNFLDDDDELMPHHLTTLLTAPRSQGERVIYARTRVHDQRNQAIGHCNLPGYHVQFFYQNRSTTCATLFHRSLVDEGARFDPAFPIYEDHDFYINCATRTPFRFVDAPTSIWHAFSGDSGCGHGANDDATQRHEYRVRLRKKWLAQFEVWWRDAEGLIFTGQHYLKEGDAETALACLERALKIRPDDVNALNLCGVASMRSGRLDRAEVLFVRALERMPQNAGILKNLQLVRTQRAAAP